MKFLVFKYVVTAALVVAVSELGKRSGRAGALLASLPLVTVLTLIWLHVERQPDTKIVDHAYYTFFYVVPTLPMFLVFPALHTRIGFWPTLLVCALLTVVCFYGFALGMRRFGVELLP